MNEVYSYIAEHGAVTLGELQQAFPSMPSVAKTVMNLRRAGKVVTRYNAELKMTTISIEEPR